jgi:hypothetical protein
MRAIMHKLLVTLVYIWDVSESAYEIYLSKWRRIIFIYFAAHALYQGQISPGVVYAALSYAFPA